MESKGGFYSKPVAMSSLDDTWTTPRDFFNKVNDEFGFTLDAAALQSSALCDKWFGPDHPDVTRQDAFKNDWSADAGDGAIWLNPPYGKTIREWMAKARDEAIENGGIVVSLVPARTDTRWFHESCLGFEIRLIKGRLKFGNSTDAAPFPSALIVMSRETWNSKQNLMSF